DRHSDPDHDRTVFTLAGEPDALEAALAAGAAAAIKRIDISAHEGLPPALGAPHACPPGRPHQGEPPTPRAPPRPVEPGNGGPRVRVSLCGGLAAGPDRRERAYFRNGGLAELSLRMKSGELRPDRGPPIPHPTAGATLVTARPPLAAFNVELDSGDVEVARAVAAALREAGGGPRGVRAIGLVLASGRAQVSTNVHDPLTVPLGEVVGGGGALAAPRGAGRWEAELVGLIPAAALRGYPEDVPMRGFDPARHVIERRLEALS